MKAIILAFPALVAAILGADVSTANGKIVGHPALKSPDVIEWLGIPYAQPPVGELRFAPPQGHTSNGSGVYVASNYGNDCLYTPSSLVDYPDKTPQFDRIFEDFAAINNNTQSEDCLKLNIWSKSSQSSQPSSLKPVYVHFYGGRWTSGTTNTPFYYGGYFAEAEDIIVVTATYRMNIFGFPGNPGNSPNVGLQDQRLAVEWVKKNIRGFGGDPDRIVISGQSCGGASVDYWAYAYRSDPLVKGLISHSGTALSFSVNTPEVAAQHWYNVSAKLGCGSSGDVLPCMRKCNPNDIRAAAAAVKVPASNPARKAPAFQPTIDNMTVFANYTDLSSNGKFARLPYLVGHNANEAGFYKIAAYAQGSNLTANQWTDFNLETFFCPSNLEASDRSRTKTPAWRFEYHADWNNTRLYPTSGAYHGVDLNMIYGASEDVSKLPESTAQSELQTIMQKAWGAFISDPQNGLLDLGWPTYDPKGATLIELGVNNEPKVTFASTSEYDQQCANLLAGL